MEETRSGGPSYYCTYQTNEIALEAFPLHSSKVFLPKIFVFFLEKLEVRETWRYSVSVNAIELDLLVLGKSGKSSTFRLYALDKA